MEGKTPHPCPMCPKRYAKNHSLLQHMAKVHAVSNPDNVGIDVTDVGTDVTDVTAKTEDGDNTARKILVSTVLNRMCLQSSASDTQDQV